MQGRRVLIVDDSSTARNQVRTRRSPALDSSAIECQDGLHAPSCLKGGATGRKVTDEIMLMITDEMHGDGWLPAHPR